ncbi:hypothetical protein ACN4EG_12675 [Alkalinema pantanalense CENA528]|uniref:hypothetical protein n=1 Tax=Alkalinema pantanalense TaxID=1620705 RepID=UPI003D6F3830
MAIHLVKKPAIVGLTIARKNFWGWARDRFSEFLEKVAGNGLFALGIGSVTFL